MSLMVRVKSAAIFFVIFLIGIINPWSFLFVFALFMLIALSEVLAFAKKLDIFPAKSLVYLLSIAFFAFCFLYAQQKIDYYWIFALIAGIFLLFIVELFRNQANPLGNISFVLFALVYVGLPFGLLNFIAFYPAEKSEINRTFLIIYFALIWTSDIAAYFIGSRFGKRPLFKRISPNKSVEGLLGSVIFTFSMALIIAYFVKTFSYPDALAFGVIISIFGPIGDLIESMFKRQLMIKDSGNIMPGHGGLLDRFDSTILTSIFVVLYLYLIKNLFAL